MLRYRPIVPVAALPIPNFATTTTIASHSPATSARAAGGIGPRADHSGTCPSAEAAGRTGEASRSGY